MEMKIKRKWKSKIRKVIQETRKRNGNKNEEWDWNMGFNYGDDFGYDTKHEFQLWWLVGLRVTMGIG